MNYFCCGDDRRDVVKGQTIFNGIDFLEVVDNPSDPFEVRQRELRVHFIHPLVPGSFTAANLRIEGGERIRDIKVISLEFGGISSPPTSPPNSLPSNVLIVRVEAPGDFSIYTLRLVQKADSAQPPAGFDPVLSAVDFSFKVACDSEFDCRNAQVCPPETPVQPEINYLAKDYASFRQLIFDRMATLAPNWRERNSADIGVALVELLAYVGDYLSYQQDAVATEAYLHTARRRASVRRHTRLVDYFMHDGSNARTWVQVLAAAGTNGVALTREYSGHPTQLLTRVAEAQPFIALNSPDHEKLMALRPVVFELMHGIKLYEAHNKILFYTWDARDCCLPKGATRATLRGHFQNLKPGDVLILAEVRGPHTGEEQDADPAHRHAVRLTELKFGHDPLHAPPFSSPPASPPSSPPQFNGLPVTEIRWHDNDALPFPLCISATSGTAYYEDVSVAWGNIALADHGLTVDDVPNDKARDPYVTASSLAPDFVPRANPALARQVVSASSDCSGAQTGSHCAERRTELAPPRYRPRLKYAPVTQAANYDLKKPPASAAAAMRWTTRNVHPVIALQSFGVSRARTFSNLPTPVRWEPHRDLLASHANDHHFIVEIESDGTAYLRFGDGQFGSAPNSDDRFLARYRIGNGARGNIGLDALAHLVSGDPNINDQVVADVRNPLPARGGAEAETIEEARRNAPSAFRLQERAVTAEDYAASVLRCDPSVQRAAATFRWTGSWRTVFLTADRFGGRPVDAEFERALVRSMDRFRMAGHDLEVDDARFVSLEIAIIVCVKTSYFKSDVKAALLQLFSNRTLPDGRRGVFHPDNFTFGQTVYLSPLYAAAQSVAGVDSVEITIFQRQGSTSNSVPQSGRLEMARLEIARLDNDPDFPEHGALKLEMRGGR